MRRVVWVVLVVGLGGSVSAPLHAVAAAKAGIAIAEIVWIDGEVDRAEPPDKSVWRRVTVGDDLRTGDTLRTSDRGLVRIEFPWMNVTLGPASMISVPASTVLSTVLDHGRAEFFGPGRDIVKIEVGDGEVRGGGRLVLRRSSGRTSATALEGRFRVRALGRVVEIKAPQATLIMDGRPPQAALALPPAPDGLHPGETVGYVRLGRRIELDWSTSASQHHLELLALDDDAVLLARDVGSPPLRFEVPWLGTYRWRVSGREATGIESAPSTPGVICSVER